MTSKPITLSIKKKISKDDLTEEFVSIAPTTTDTSVKSSATTTPVKPTTTKPALVKRDCPICAENKYVYNWITCCKCNFSTCINCVEKYLLSVPEISPKCMSCKTDWSFEFICRVTDKKFHTKEYRDYRAGIAFERERSLLPETQPYIVEELRIKDLSGQIGQINVERRLLLGEYSKKDHDLLNIIQQLRTSMNLPLKETFVNISFTGHCPEQDCKGYLDTKSMCGICQKKACCHCKQSKHEGDCNPDTLKTVQLLARDTKQCPKCMVPIHKISGCSQMFCLHCHTAFDWRSGKIATGAIHNPHYYEWQRQNNNGVAPRVPGDVPVGCVNIDRIAMVLGHRSQTYGNVLRFHRLNSHLREVVLPKYTAPTTAPEARNRDLRIRFLKNDLEEKNWVATLKKRDKKLEKDNAIYNLLQMFINTMDDLIGSIEKVTHYDPIIDQIERLRVYFEDNTRIIEDTFTSKCVRIYPEWTLYVPGQNEQRFDVHRRL